MDEYLARQEAERANMDSCGSSCCAPSAVSTSVIPEPNRNRPYTTLAGATRLKGTPPVQTQVFLRSTWDDPFPLQRVWNAGSLFFGGVNASAQGKAGRVAQKSKAIANEGSSFGRWSNSKKPRF